MMFNSMDAYGFLSIHPSLWFPLKTQQIPAVPPVGTTKKCPDESQTSEHLPATQVMKKLSHPNIIRCYGYFWDYPSQSLYIALWPVLEERIFRWKSPVAAENLAQFFRVKQRENHGKKLEKPTANEFQFVDVHIPEYVGIGLDPVYPYDWDFVLSNRFWVLF